MSAAAKSEAASDNELSPDEEGLSGEPGSDGRERDGSYLTIRATAVLSHCLTAQAHVHNTWSRT
jgi:hypothetical protein